MPREYDRDRFEQLALYIASRSANDLSFGKTKLAKILFYSDFAAYRQLGDSITGAEYTKRKHGPFPRVLKSALDRIVKRGAGVLRETEYFGHKQTRLVPIGHVDISVFTPEEIRLVNKVIEKLRRHDATAVSDLSHQEPAWRFVEPSETIPYELAWVGAGEVPPDVAEIGREVAERLGFVKTA